MFKRKRNAFTLIELIAVLVIMAILALIVTPLVMNIIRKARISADRRSVDAYGRSIELAIASYLLDTGKFPTDVSQLTIEYSGNQVVCSTTQLNSDSSVYLAGCTVAGRSTGDYEYGKYETPIYRAYSISQSASDIVTYNGVDYYVIENSDTTQSTVTLLKAEPLSVEEVTSLSPAFCVTNRDGYGGIPYNESDVKLLVDAWKVAKAPEATDARLITLTDLTNNLGYEVGQICSVNNCTTTESHVNTPSWVYNSNYSYWTSSPYEDSMYNVWVVNRDGSISNSAGYSFQGCSYVSVRPVIVLPKSLISTNS